MQRTKQSMFSSLGEAMRGAVFADLYAGAGAVGIEAWSRGAAYVHFVEQDRDALEALADNLRSCGVPAACADVHAASVVDVLDARPSPIADADIVFADPPYETDVAEELLGRVTLDAMARLAWLVVEHRTRTRLVAPPGMLVERQRRFGDTTLSTFVVEERRTRSEEARG
jgi:16S rRNA (guanine966-N2)-methyltransferase